MRQRIPLFLFLALYGLFVLWTYRDYGLTWDERDVYKEGFDLFQYFHQGLHLFSQPPVLVLDPEHNYPYSALLAWFNPSFNPFTYHLLNLLFAGVLYAASFELLLWQYGSPWLCLAGPVFLFLNLPFSGSVPGNPKDVPFASLYFLSLGAVYFFEKEKVRWAWKGLVLGLLFGLAVSSRMVGMALFPLWSLYELVRYCQNKTGTLEGWLGKKCLEGLLILVICGGVCTFLWPYLHIDTFQHWVNVLWLTNNFPPHFKFLFLGNLADSLDYPWYLLPVWIAVATPIFLLGFSGWICAQPRRWNPLVLLTVLAFFLNLSFFVLLKPAIYDGLRHGLFLLPILSLLAAAGFVEWANSDRKLWARVIWGGAAGLNVLLVLAHLFRLHPYEYLYFNELTGGVKGAYGRFETDYWAASLRESVEWLKANEATNPSRVYKVFAEGNPYQSILFFAPNMKPFARAEADYVILINRAGGKPRPEDQSKVIHVVEREGAPLSFILKMK